MIRRLLFAGSVLLTGCLDANAEAPPTTVLCESTDECDGGEVCSSGFCYGNPPANVVFAAIIEPPVSSEEQLVPTELSLLSVDESGQLTNLRFETPVVIRGQVILACSPETDPAICGSEHPIAATIEARRPSRIPGAPPLVRRATAEVGMNGEAPSFELALPASSCNGIPPADCDSAYVVTVTPHGNEIPTSSLGPAELAPPLTTRIVVDSNLDTILTVGAPSALKTVTGCIIYAEGLPGVPDYQVTVFGRLRPEGVPVRASSRAITDGNGCFEVRLPRNLINEFDFVFEPTGKEMLPTVRLSSVDVPDGAAASMFSLDPPIELPNFSSPVQVTVPIAAVSSSGQRVLVPGADVQFFTEFESEDPRDMRVTFTTTATTGVDGDNLGQVQVNLFPGNREYDLVILPTGDSEFGARFDGTISVGSTGGVVQAVEVERRHAVRGRMLNEFGEPIADAPITARPSSALLFDILSDRNDMTATQHPLLKDLSYSTVTEEDGSFFMWVNPELGGITPSYDFHVEPPLSADAPQWTFEAIELSGDVLELGSLRLPRASYTRGRVSSADGSPVAEAKLLVYQVPDAGFCDQECEPPPYLRSVRLSDESGDVTTVVLPDPR